MTEERTCRAIFAGAVLGLAWLLVGCQGRTGTPKAPTGGVVVSLSDARHFEIRQDGEDRIVHIRGAWDDARSRISCRLVRDRSRRSAQAIVVPAKRIVCLSSTHLGFLQELGSLEVVAGVSLLQHVANAEIRGKIESGRIATVGEGAQLDVERLIAMNPDVVLAFGVSAGDLEPFGPVQRAGVPVIACADYTEDTPLGRAEWIKFFGLLVGKEELAEQRFAQVRSAYNALAEKGRKVEPKPTVLVNASFQGVWYAPGGGSYMARYLADAGARYLWADDTSQRVLRLDFETVLAKGSGAEYWLHPGFWSSLADGLANDERYRLFRSFQTGNVFNHNRLGDLTTGNDFFERGVARPDLVLADLVWVFHPDLVPGHRPIWYHRLAEK